MAGPAKIQTFQALEVHDPQVGLPALVVVALTEEGVIWVWHGRWRRLALPVRYKGGDE